MTHFDDTPEEIFQRMTIITRTEGSAGDYDEVTYSEATNLVYGIFQQTGGQEEAREDGRVINYNAEAMIKSTDSIIETDVISFQGVRYSVIEIDTVYDGTSVDHKHVRLVRAV